MIWLIIKEAWLSLSSHKLRTFLTTLGIIIGVSAVVMMVAAGQTVSLVINNSFASMGGNLLMIHPSFVFTSGIKSGQRPTITAADVEATKTLKGVDAAAPIVRATAQGVYGANNWTVSIRGTTPDLITVNKWEIERGEPFTEKDVKAHLKKNIANFKIPKYVYFPDDLPLTTIGKILKRKLKEMVLKGEIEGLK